jgi:hypothetical protein
MTPTTAIDEPDRQSSGNNTPGPAAPLELGSKIGLWLLIAVMGLLAAGLFRDVFAFIFR